MTDARDDRAPAAGAAHETEIPWDEASTFVRRRLAYELPVWSHGQIDDLVQEAMVRLLRAVRRERIDNLEALLTQMARRCAIDALRRRTRWKALIDPEDDDFSRHADPRARTDEPGDPLERLQFVVLEYFAVHDARCLELASAYFAEQDWKAVATASGRSHDSIRKQWSRCLDHLRQAAHEEHGPLMAWARDA